MHVYSQQLSTVRVMSHTEVNRHLMLGTYEHGAYPSISASTKTVCNDMQEWMIIHLPQARNSIG